MKAIEIAMLVLSIFALGLALLIFGHRLDICLIGRNHKKA